MFKLNVNDGIDTLHVEHPWEECNTDEADGLESVDDETAAAMIASGTAVACKHCQPTPRAV